MRSAIIYLTLFIFSPSSLFCQNGDAIIFLVRHADRSGNDDVLSDAGRQRAQTLMHVLEQVHLDAIFSTDYSRTKETVKPLANGQKLDINIYDPGDLNGLIETLKSQYAGGRVLVVGHSNTIPQTINALGVQPALQDLDHGAYDDLFMVILKEGSDPTLVALQYGVRDDH